MATISGEIHQFKNKAGTKNWWPRTVTEAIYGLDSTIADVKTWVGNNYQAKYAFTISGTSGATYNLATIATQAANGNSAYNSLSNYLTTSSAAGTYANKYIYRNHSARETSYTGPTYLSTYVGNNAIIERGSWNYASNGYIDTGVGIIHLAGTMVVAVNDTAHGSALFITPSTSYPQTGTGAKNEMFFFTQNGNNSDYPDAWTRVVTNRNFTDVIGTTTYAPYNSAGYLPLSGGTMTGSITSNSNIYTSGLMRSRLTYFLNVAGTDNAGYVGRGDSNDDLHFINYGENSIHFGTKGAVSVTIDKVGVMNLINLNAAPLVINRKGGGDFCSIEYKKSSSLSLGWIGIYNNRGPVYSPDYSNFYNIYHSGNLTQSIVTGLIGSTTYAPYNANGYAVKKTYNDLMHAGNEFTFVSPGYSGDIYINWRTASGAHDGNIATYRFLNGAGGSASIAASQFIVSGGTSSQFLKGDGSLDSSTYMTTDTAQTITGVKTFSDAGKTLLGADVYRHEWHNSYAYPAPAWNAWHDHFAFLRYHTIQDVQVTTDGSTWTASSKDLKPLFIHKENTFVQVLDAADRAFRFTLYSSYVFHVCNIYWLSFGTGYSSPFPNFTLKAECSADNSTWTTWGEHTITMAQASYCVRLSSLPLNQKYLRFTFTKTTNLTTGTVRLCAFSGLTFRKGDQGLGKEYSYPFSWDTGVNLLPLNMDVSTLGTASYKWHTVYGTTGNFTEVKTNYIMDESSKHYFIGMAASGLGSGYTGALILAYGNNPIHFYTGGTPRMYIGGTGNVGIGTQSPSHKLDVRGNIALGGPASTGKIGCMYSASDSGMYNQIEFTASNNSGTGDIIYKAGIWTNGDHIAHAFQTYNNASAFVIRNNGNIGIGTSTPGYKFQVNGVIRSTVGIFSDGYVSALGTASSSDAKLKDDITTISYDRAKEVLSALNPREWTWNALTSKKGERGAGMVAQEVESILPDTVKEIGGNLTLEYNTLFAYGLAMTKYLVPAVESLEERVTRLERENEELKRQLTN